VLEVLTLFVMLALWFWTVTLIPAVIVESGGRSPAPLTPIAPGRPGLRGILGTTAERRQRNSVAVGMYHREER
jgi:hypothetical protein